MFDGRTLIARHQRCTRPGDRILNLDHYLEVLKTKPGALPGRPRWLRPANGSFTPAHEAFWAAARRTDGDTDGTHALIDVLLLQRVMAADDVIVGITAALQVGAVTADVVAVEARRHIANTDGSESDRHLDAPTGPAAQRVVSLTQRRLAGPAAVIAGLPPDRRTLPTVTHYGQLLPSARKDTGT